MSSLTCYSVPIKHQLKYLYIHRYIDFLSCAQCNRIIKQIKYKVKEINTNLLPLDSSSCNTPNLQIQSIPHKKYIHYLYFNLISQVNVITHNLTKHTFT